MIAGKATPIDASTMWKPSVKAIWLRAHPSWSDAAMREPLVSNGAPSRCRRGFELGRDVFVPPDRGGLRAIEHLGSARLAEVVPAPVHERVDAIAHAGHQR